MFGIAIGVGLAAFAIGATIMTGGSLVLLGASFAIGATASFVGQGVGNLMNGEDFFHDISIGSILMGGLAGAAFATGIGGFWGAVGIGAASNAGASALENKSWSNIMASAIVGGLAAGIGFAVGRFVANNLPQDLNLGFKTYYELGQIDAGMIHSCCHAVRASWYTFVPTVTTAVSRAVVKTLGNKGIGWF